MTSQVQVYGMKLRTITPMEVNMKSYTVDIHQVIRFHIEAEDEVSFLLDLVHEYYAKDDSVEPLIEKLWRLDRLIQLKDVRTDKAWRQA